jgi:hypothetical protein
VLSALLADPLQEHISVELNEGGRYEGATLTIKGNTSEEEQTSQAQGGKTEGKEGEGKMEGAKAIAKRARSFAVSLRLPEVSPGHSLLLMSGEAVAFETCCCAAPYGMSTGQYRQWPHPTMCIDIRTTSFA